MRLHEADDAEIAAMWPAARAARLFETQEAFEKWRVARSWAVRINDQGEAVVLMRWREHLDVLHIRGAWCSASHVANLLEDVRTVGTARGLPRLLSPMLEEHSAGPYVRAGLAQQLRLVTYKVKPASLVLHGRTEGVRLREAAPADADGIVAVESDCFDDFWRHGHAEVDSAIAAGRVVVAEVEGEVIGYTLTTLSRGSATLARVAVRTDVQKQGIGRVLVADAVGFAEQAGAPTLSLCTQESNASSRALYTSMGFIELRDRMVLAGDPGIPL